MEIYSYEDLSSRLQIIKGFTDLTSPEDFSGLVSQIRPYLHNVIGITIGKGGVGKTTIGSNIAYTLAEEQKRRAEEGKSALPVLHIELDANGNGRSDFGLLGSSFDDDGQSFYEAVVEDGPLKVIKDVRPFLDIVPSGKRNADIASAVSKLNDEHSLAAFLLLALLLAQISSRYRWIILDFSPSDKSNQRLGLGAVTHLLAPIKGSDEGVLTGLGTLATLVRDIRRINPEVAIAAITFLAFKKVRGEATSELNNLRTKIEMLLDQARIDHDVLVPDYIRDAPVLAALCRNTGTPAKELALAATGNLMDAQGAPVPHPRDENDRRINADLAVGLANDYTALTQGVIQRVRQRNKVLRGEA